MNYLFSIESLCVMYKELYGKCKPNKMGHSVLLASLHCFMEIFSVCYLYINLACRFHRFL